MLRSIYRNTVPLMPAEQLHFEMKRDSSLVILDTREPDEYQISHIPRAQSAGYDHFDMKAYEGLEKDTKIIVYCSVGYRSERIGEQLKAKGFTNVFNLYGGIFHWTNNAYHIQDPEGNPAKAVHGYNKNWSKWINQSRCNATW